MILRPSYLHNGISYTGKITSLYWIRAQIISQCGQWSSRGQLVPWPWKVIVTTARAYIKGQGVGLGVSWVQYILSLILWLTGGDSRGGHGIYSVMSLKCLLYTYPLQGMDIVIPSCTESNVFQMGIFGQDLTLNIFIMQSKEYLVHDWNLHMIQFWCIDSQQANFSLTSLPLMPQSVLTYVPLIRKLCPLWLSHAQISGYSGFSTLVWAWGWVWMGTVKSLI